MLSDSNIDWGQDLKLLANWQKKHPDTPMYLWYFGTADPHYYGMHYINMPGSTAPADPSGKPPRTIAEMSPRRRDRHQRDDAAMDLFPTAARAAVSVLGQPARRSAHTRARRSPCWAGRSTFMGWGRSRRRNEHAWWAQCRLVYNASQSEAIVVATRFFDRMSDSRRNGVCGPS